MVAWAQRIGENTAEVVHRIFASVPVVEQGLDPALAVVRLSKRYSQQRVEAACSIALTSRIPSPRYAHLRPILDTGQDKTGTITGAAHLDAAGYVRGADYYGGEAK